MVHLHRDRHGFLKVADVKPSFILTVRSSGHFIGSECREKISFIVLMVNPCTLL